MIHWVARQDLVSHRQGKPEDDLGLFGAVVGLLGQLLEEVIAAGYAQLAQGELSQDRQHERAHFALVEVARGLGEPVCQLDVFQPVGDQIGQRAACRQRREGRLEQAPLGKLPRSACFLVSPVACTRRLLPSQS